MSDGPVPIDGFSTYSFTSGDDARTVYWSGPKQRPGVILMHELGGMSSSCVELGRLLSAGEGGYQVHLPLLFGEAEQEVSTLNTLRGLWCIRQEMSWFSKSRPSPITAWIADLVSEVADRTGIERVGVIGMCLTGGLVFGLVAEPNVAAGVASQPSLPIGITPSLRRSLGVPDEWFSEQPPQRETPLMALRYREDYICPRARLEHLAEVYGEQLEPAPEGVVQDVTFERLRIRDIPGKGHSVLTESRNQPADAASISEVKGFLDRHLDQD